MTQDNYSLHDNKNIARAKVDKEYLGELMLHNEDLIWFSIRNYVGDPVKLAQNNLMEKEDIHQVGRIGFINAVKKFDCSKGVLFTTYAPAVIAGEVKSYLRDRGKLIKLPRSIYELNARILAYTESIQYNKYIPTEKITEEVDADYDDIKKILTIGYYPMLMPPKVKNDKPDNCLSLNNKIDENVNVEEKVIDEIYVTQLLDAVRKKLTERDKRILDAKLEGKTNEQIAKEANIAKITVTRTMNKIRKIIKEIHEE